MATVEVDKASLQANFERNERGLRLRFARIGAILAIVLVPAGGLLDYLIYPQDWGLFLQIRLVCVLVIVLIASLLYSSVAERFGAMLAALLGITPSLAICGIIYLADGVASSYYAGLMLIMIAVTQLLQSLWEALFVSLLIVGSYVVACLMHPVDDASTA